MCEYTDYFRMMESGQWAEINPSKCRCQGAGWVNSEMGTWHKCPIHGAGVPHPEWAHDEESGFNWNAHKHTLYVAAYTTFRGIARKHGFNGNFKEACRAIIGPKALAANHVDWVNAAETIATEAADNAEEARARDMDYESTFEMHMHEDAMIERQESCHW
jgi:hypothetical protein